MIFKFLDDMWGPQTDSFPYVENATIEKINSRYWNPDFSAVARYKASENNY